MVNVSEYTSPMDPMGTGYQTPDFWTINRKGAASWDDVWGEEVTNHPKKTRGCLKTTRWNDHKLHLSSLEVTFFGGEVIGCPYEIHCRNQQCHPLEFLSQWAKTCKNITEHPPPHFSCVCVVFFKEGIMPFTKKHVWQLLRFFYALKFPEVRKWII